MDRYVYKYHYCVFLLLLSALWGNASASSVDEQAPFYNDAVRFLDQQGYPQADVVLLAAWNERSISGYRTGYRVQHTKSGETFVLYSRDGVILPKETHISPKKWDNLPVNIPAQQGIAVTSTAKTAIPKPKSIVYAMPPVFDIVMPEIDQQQLDEEDAQEQSQGEKQVKRLGIYRQLPVSIDLCGDVTPDMGEWRSLADGGLLWSVRLISPDAVGQRIEIQKLQLPEDASLMLYNEHFPEEKYGPFTDIPSQDGTLWTPTCFNESVILECYIPSAKELENTHLSIKRIAHIYHDPSANPSFSIGACNRDLACYPHWQETASAIGGMTIAGTNGIIFCSCTLLASGHSSNTPPLVLTANHCVDRQKGVHSAASLEFYWQYQNPYCHSPFPPISEALRTFGGADYLAGMSGTGFYGGGNDFTLLRLRECPSEPLTRLGWTNQTPPKDTAVITIHHPRGAPKHISFGHTINRLNLHQDLYHQVVWNIGTTEPGASGAPLILFESRQLIGQLWGGYASCFFFWEPDYFGRYDVAYPIIQPYLEPPAFRFSQNQLTVSETTEATALPISLQGISDGLVQVDVTIAGGTAQWGTDYSLSGTTLCIPCDSASQSLSIQIHPDTTHEEDENILLLLENPASATIETQYNQLILLIEDDDPDRDGDGLSDYDEEFGTFGYNSNPDQVDTDGDTLTDFEEVTDKNGYITDPNERDTDGDGVSDAREIAWNLNPLDPNDGKELPFLKLPWFQTVPLDNAHP